MCLCMCGHHILWQEKDQPGEVANPARGQLKNEKIFPLPRSHLRTTWSRETGSAVPSRVSLLISILKLILVLTYYGIPPDFRGGVQSSSMINRTYYILTLAFTTWIATSQAMLCSDDSICTAISRAGRRSVGCEKQ